MGATSSDHPLVDVIQQADAIASNKLDSTRFQVTITSADASSATQLKAGVSDKKIYILSVIISVDTEMSVQLQDDAGTPNVLMEQIYMAANTTAGMAFHLQSPLVVDTDNDLDVITSAAGNISVTVTGYIK